jgi:exosortase
VISIAENRVTVSELSTTAATKPAAPKSRPATEERASVQGVLIALAPALAIVVATWWDSLRQLVAIWDKDPSYSHGYLVPLASAGFALLAWRRGKPDLHQAATWQGVSTGACEIVLGLLLHAVAWMTSLLLLDVIGLICTVRGVLLLVGGPSVNQKFGFAALFLIFMAPLPPLVYQAAALTMQHFVSVVSTACLETIGIAAFRQGNRIFLTDLPMDVGEACSGLRGITAILALGLAIGELYQSSRPMRWLLVILALPVAVAANCLRVTLTGIIMVLFGRKWAEDVYHTLEGLATMLMAAAVLLLIAWVLGKYEQRWGWQKEGAADSV